MKHLVTSVVLGSAMWVMMAGPAAAQQVANAGATNGGPPPPVAPVAGTFPGAPSPEAATPSTTAVAAPAARTAHNSIYIELAGNGGIYTVNYDRLVNEHFSVRAGLGYMALGASASSTSGGTTTTASASVSMLAIPVIANFLLGNANHKLELGGGLTLFKMTGTSSTFDGVASGTAFAPVGTLVAGYRYVPADGGFTFRIGFTPLVSTEDFMPWGGISFGYLF
jgi:hypothetical protein